MSCVVLTSTKMRYIFATMTCDTSIRMRMLRTAPMLTISIMLGLQDSMMYALSNDYFEGREKEEVKKLESFLRQQFGVKTFTDKSFFTDVVIKNKAVIYAGLVDEATMLTFLEYLKRDADRLFDDTMSFNDIKDMPLLAYDGTIVRARELNIQYIEYNEDAKILCEKAWCPEDVCCCSHRNIPMISLRICVSCSRL